MNDDHDAAPTYVPASRASEATVGLVQSSWDNNDVQSRIRGRLCDSIEGVLATYSVTGSTGRVTTIAVHLMSRHGDLLETYKFHVLDAVEGGDMRKISDQLAAGWDGAIRTFQQAYLGRREGDKRTETVISGGSIDLRCNSAIAMNDTYCSCEGCTQTREYKRKSAAPSLRPRTMRLRSYGLGVEKVVTFHMNDADFVTFQAIIGAVTIPTGFTLDYWNEPVKMDTIRDLVQETLKDLNRGNKLRFAEISEDYHKAEDLKTREKAAVKRNVEGLTDLGEIGGRRAFIGKPQEADGKLFMSQASDPNDFSYSPVPAVVVKACSIQPPTSETKEGDPVLCLDGHRAEVHGIPLFWSNGIGDVMWTAVQVDRECMVEEMRKAAAKTVFRKTPIEWVPSLDAAPEVRGDDEPIVIEGGSKCSDERT